MSTDLAGRPAAELAASIRRREVTSTAVVGAHLDRIAAENDALNAFVTVVEDRAREKAHEADRALDEGAAIGPLHGVPIAIKDLFDFLAGVRNTFGAKPFAEFEPRNTALYVERLEDAGAIVLGKTNTPEFGYKGTTDNLLFGPTSTPFDPDANAGGSSGGSAAAVAAGMVPLAQGTDGAGSLRIPASFCGVVGYKPSFGRVPQVNRPDAFVSHTPFIHVGPLARTVEDAALFAEAVAGPHPRDPWSLPDDGTDYLGATIRGIDRHSVAFSPDLGSFPVTDAVAAVVEEAVDGFRDAGASVDRVAIDPDVPRERMEEVILSELGLTNVSVVESFADSGIDLLGDHRGDLPGDFVEMVERARETDVVDYKRSEFVRTAMYDAVQDVFEDHDILVTPTVAVPTIENADDGLTTGPEEIDGEPVEPLLGWSLGYPFNFTGHPAASVPAGRTDRGIPVGLQIVAPRHDDETLLAAAAAFERVRPWREIYEDV